MRFKFTWRENLALGACALGLTIGGCVNTPDLMEACKKACAPSRMALQSATMCSCQTAPSAPDGGPR